MNNNRNQLNTGNKAFIQLRRTLLSFQNLQFRKRTTTHSNRKIKNSGWQKHLSYQKEKDSSKKGKFIGKIDRKLSSHTD